MTASTLSFQYEETDNWNVVIKQFRRLAVWAEGSVWEIDGEPIVRDSVYTHIQKTSDDQTKDEDNNCCSYFILEHEEQ